MFLQHGIKKLALIILLLSCSYSGTIDDLNKLLLKATWDGDVKKCRELIHAGADVNCADDITGFTPLIRAIIQSDIDMIKLLLSYNADVNKTANLDITPIQTASLNGMSHCIVTLLAHAGADTHKQSQWLLPDALSKYLEAAKVFIELTNKTHHLDYEDV